MKSIKLKIKSKKQRTGISSNNNTIIRIRKTIINFFLIFFLKKRHLYLALKSSFSHLVPISPSSKTVTLYSTTTCRLSSSLTTRNTPTLVLPQVADDNVLMLSLSRQRERERERKGRETSHTSEGDKDPKLVLS